MGLETVIRGGYKSTRSSKRDQAKGWRRLKKVSKKAAERLKDEEGLSGYAAHLHIICANVRHAVCQQALKQRLILVASRGQRPRNIGHTLLFWRGGGQACNGSAHKTTWDVEA